MSNRDRRIGMRIGRMLDTPAFRTWLSRRDGLNTTSYDPVFDHVANTYCREPGATGRCTKLISDWERRNEQ